MLLDAMGLMGRATRISSSTDVAVVLAFAVVCVAAFDPRETLSVLPTYMAAIPLCFAVPAGFFVMRTLNAYRACCRCYAVCLMYLCLLLWLTSMLLPNLHAMVGGTQEEALFLLARRPHGART